MEKTNLIKALVGSIAFLLMGSAYAEVCDVADPASCQFTTKIFSCSPSFAAKAGDSSHHILCPRPHADRDISLLANNPGETFYTCKLTDFRCYTVVLGIVGGRTNCSLKSPMSITLNSVRNVNYIGVDRSGGPVRFRTTGRVQSSVDITVSNNAKEAVGMEIQCNKK